MRHHRRPGVRHCHQQREQIHYDHDGHDHDGYDDHHHHPHHHDIYDDGHHDRYEGDDDDRHHHQVCTNVTETLCSPITKTVSDYTFEDK